MTHQLTPEEIMRRCLELAAHGAGSVSPNPMVGAALVHDGRIVGEGFHKKFGGPHAEVEAIRSVLDSRLLPESTLYVTLEPCSHFGKTPPCADLILESKIPNVIVATRDPNSLVDGSGIWKLENAGVKVEIGLLEGEARELNRGFFSFHERKRPWIILKWAQTADGFIARTDGTSKWISGEKSRELVHRWRAVEDAVLVGANTARLDDPALTVRNVEGRNPLRVLVDRSGEIPPNAKFMDKAAPTLVLTAHREEEVDGVRYRKLQSRLRFAESICEALFKEKVLTVIIEGGTKTLNAFIEEGLWDEARVFCSKETFGRGLAAPALPIAPDRTERAGEDELSWYRKRD